MKKVSENKRLLFKQTILFGIVGAITMAIDVGVSSLLFYNMHLPVYLASAGGYLSGFVFNFPMNRKRVFNHSSDDRFPLMTQMALYGLLCIFNLVTTSVLVDMIVNMDVATIQIAKIVTTLVMALWNFLIFKWYIFSKKTDIQKDSD